jgi:hypothetical protein
MEYCDPDAGCVPLPGTGDSCRTSDAPNFAGRCSSAADVLLPSGCQLVYNTSYCCNAAGYREYEWNVQECRDGVWARIDSGADVIRCSGCPPETRDDWSDTCGDAAANEMVCP